MWEVVLFFILFVTGTIVAAFWHSRIMTDLARQPGSVTEISRVAAFKRLCVAYLTGWVPVGLAWGFLLPSDRSPWWLSGAFFGLFMSTIACSAAMFHTANGRWFRDQLRRRRKRLGILPGA